MRLLMSLLVVGTCFTSAMAAKQDPPTQEGKASYYANKFEGGRTSSGERVKLHQLTGAHRSLPFNTLVEVTNKANNRSVVIRINDRGPFCKGRIVDMTTAAARVIGLLGRGVASVTLRVLSSAEAKLFASNSDQTVADASTDKAFAAAPATIQPTAVLLD